MIHVIILPLAITRRQRVVPAPGIVCMVHGYRVGKSGRRELWQDLGWKVTLRV